MPCSSEKERNLLRIGTFQNHEAMRLSRHFQQTAGFRR
jgi:hypothetical protein